MRRSSLLHQTNSDMQKSFPSHVRPRPGVKASSKDFLDPGSHRGDVKSTSHGLSPTTKDEIAPSAGTFQRNYIATCEQRSGAFCLSEPGVCHSGGQEATAPGFLPRFRTRVDGSSALRAFASCHAGRPHLPDESCRCARFLMRMTSQGAICIMTLRCRRPLQRWMGERRTGAKRLSKNSFPRHSGGL
jgi:hypothetical protein